VIAIAIPSERWCELKIQGCLSAGKHNPQMFCLICSCEAQHGGLNAGQFEQAGGTKRSTTTKQESSIDIVLSATHNNLGSTIVEAAPDKAFQTPAIHARAPRSKYWMLLCFIEDNKTLLTGNEKGAAIHIYLI
jgi:hypothetical protein